MRDHPSAGDLTGSLLVAHPNLHDPSFRRTILFLSHHNAEDGAIGLVLNRPFHETVGDFPEQAKHVDQLKRVPVFYGGPVGSDELLFASIQWRDTPEALAFRGFGNASDGPVIPPEYQPNLRAFLGHSGWSRGQLEGEIAEKSWLVFPPTRRVIDAADPETVWYDIMNQLGPFYRLLAGMPDFPGLN